MKPTVSEALGHVLVWSAAAILILGVSVLWGLGGWEYYATPIALRNYRPEYRLLRPSGMAGHLFGVAGFVLMLVPVAYAMRKKMVRLRNAGSIKTWLEVHIFCGIVGPVLVTLHTSFKFNGLVSVAYWSMILVTLSGFVGRYLYVRIPRSLRGIELTHDELDARAAALSQQLEADHLPPGLLAKVTAFEDRLVPLEGHHRRLVGLLAGEWRTHREFVMLKRELAHAGLDEHVLHDAVHVIADRAALIRQTAYLEKTKKLFNLWHVFHMPLVYVMFVIVILHVAVTLYLGYIPFFS